MNFDIVILGAGIVGAACAREISRQGFSAAIVDRDFPGSGTTSAGMGHVVVMDDSDAQFELTKRSRALWESYAEEATEEIEYEKRGTLWIASNKREFSAAVEKSDYYTARGVGAEVIESRDLRKLEPNLRHGLAGGLLVPDDAVVYQITATESLLGSVDVTFVEGQVTSVEKDTVTLRDGTRLSAGKIVNALGLSAPLVSPEVDIEPKKGHLLVTERSPGFAHRQVLELGYLDSAHSATDESVAFNVQPRATGQFLIGSSRQPCVSDKKVEQRMISKMLERAFAFMPDLKKLRSLRSWTGLRPATPDNLPAIGPSVTNDAVIVAAGHEGLGIATSLETARLVGAYVKGTEIDAYAGAFLPSRFV